MISVCLIMFMAESRIWFIVVVCKLCDLCGGSCCPKSV